MLFWAGWCLSGVKVEWPDTVLYEEIIHLQSLLRSNTYHYSVLIMQPIRWDGKSVAIHLVVHFVR